MLMSFDMSQQRVPDVKFHQYTETARTITHSEVYGVHTHSA